MSTTTRPELSKRNPYWIEKHRYYELKHFCLQYAYWKKMLNTYDGLSRCPVGAALSEKNTDVSNPVIKCVEERQYYLDRIKLLEKVARDTDIELSSYILKAITEGLTYDIIKVKMDIPCCRDMYYDLYRRFFWLLSKERR